MKQISTKTGDGGTTSLRGGVRVEKDDARIEANGQIDHLTSVLGMVLLLWKVEGCEARNLLQSVQRELMTVMSHVATPDGAENPRVLHVDELTAHMERLVETAHVQPCFILPGKSELTTWLHIARTTARTAERRLWTLHRGHPLNQRILTFFNRLSDFLFVLAEDYALKSEV